MKFDPTLYLVTDPELTRGRAIAEIVKAAVAGGVTAVQLREKAASTRDFIKKAEELLEVLKDMGVPLIINDRVDIALAAGVDGVHLGQSDMPYKTARRILGAGAIIGVSVESADDAVVLSGQGVDYFGVSPIFATGTKPDHAPPLGLDELRTIRESVPETLIGIGGINAENAADVIAAGANGIAVVTAITMAEDPAAAARGLLENIRG